MKDFNTSLLGENVFIFNDSDNPCEVNQVIADIYNRQEADQFGSNRYAFLFMPGNYDASININVGFYTQIMGLGISPTDTTITNLSCLARWLEKGSNHNACCNFWRSIENIRIDNDAVWAVSQATDVRRVEVNGTISLHDDFGWCSGGFLADSYIHKTVDSGTQQQWLSRNAKWNEWTGTQWNAVFVGMEDGAAPSGEWPEKPYTSVSKTPIIREKPFLVYDDEFGMAVCVPGIRKESNGTSWNDGFNYERVESLGAIDGTKNYVLPLNAFYIARPDSQISEINNALKQGKGIIFTPGIYEYSKPIEVVCSNSILLGLGLATIKNTADKEILITGDVGGTIIAGLLFDAGEMNADTLVRIGTGEGFTCNKSGGDNATPILLSDLYFRVGGVDTPKPCRAKSCIIIDTDNVIGDNFWVWRADHGSGVAWEKNVCPNGLIVNGRNVTIYALMVEHFHEYQVIWNGEKGRVYMYQSEIPYDVPCQEKWMSHDGEVEGYSSFYVDDAVDDFYACGLGIYLYNRDTEVMLNSAMEVPCKDGVQVENICTVMLNGNPGMRHIINNSGGSVMRAVEREIIRGFPIKREA